MPRSNQEMIQENIELSAEFSKYLFGNPDLEDLIPPDSEIILLPEFDKELKISICWVKLVTETRLPMSD
jgi:hypothetical protein